MEKQTSSPLDRMQTMKKEIRDKTDFESRRKQMEHLFQVIGEVGKMTVNFDQAMQNLEKIKKVNPDIAESLLDKLFSSAKVLLEYFDKYNKSVDKTDEDKNGIKKLSLDKDPRFFKRDLHAPSGLKSIPLVEIPEIFERINEVARFTGSH